ncbi:MULTISPECIES: LysR substrate-binding domain-containing protein [unclassified Cupriavidus]|uniref:LysR substrate-binding domain-containing protein n=1 Tax=unclassified Cupriavidus TaxID=2640874 RepID=UPI00313D24C5
MHARVLRYLDEVVRRGSIRQAAVHLHVAPTAINRQILDLEAELGAPLFERIQRRLVLTPLGEMVVAHARQTLREHEALRARIADIRHARRGVVTVAVTAALAGAWMPSLVHDFRQRHPGIAVRVADLPVESILRAVEEGDADIGLGYDLPDLPALRIVAGSHWQIGAVVAPGHPLAGQVSVQLAECAGYPLLLPAPSLSIRALIDGAFAAAALEVVPVVESTSIELLQRLAAAGSGVALLNPLDVREARAHGSVVYVPLRDAGLPRQTLRLVTRARGVASPAAQLMAEAMAAAMAVLER